MNNRFIFLISLIFALPFFHLTETSLAQEINDYSSEFSIEIIPNDPRPGERVSAKIVSYQFDPGRSEITWTLDGKTIAKGMGEKTVSFILPPLGKEIVLTADILTNNGTRTAKARKFSGSDIDFLWEAETAIPAAYKGKALGGRKSVVKVTALPHLFASSGLVLRDNLNYEWSLNYKNLPDSSGMDKNTLRLRLNDLGDYAVGLKVSTGDKRASFQKYLHLTAEGVEPKVLFYKDDPLEGPLFSKALSRQVDLSGGDLTVRAEPFFFNKENGVSSFKWSMNGQSIKPGKKPNVVSLRAEGGSGEALINFVMRKETPNVVQEAEKVVSIVF